MQRARLEEAERAEVVAELRGAEIARLEMLQDRLAPVFAQVPQDIDLFDTGLVPGDHPRLFVDMIAFVEMGRDRRLYRFVQDTRYGRIVITETERLETIAEAVTNYVARRLVEREQALAGDRTLDDAARALAAKQSAAVVAAPALRARRGRGLGRLLLGIVDAVGAVVLIIALAAAAYWLWLSCQDWWLTR